MGQSSANRVLTRFTEVNSIPDDAPLTNDYLSEPLSSVEGSLKNLTSRIQNLENYIQNAKKKCRYPNEDNLTHDEAAAIYLYTMEWPANAESLYAIFNRDLRTKQRSQMRIWFSFLRLLMAALDKIPSQKINVCRGLRSDVSNDYGTGKVFVWTSATSCSRSINVAYQFFSSSNGQCTLFRIDTSNGKDISSYSAMKGEEEILLRPGTRFRVTQGSTLENIDGWKIPVVHLKEI